MEVVKNGLQRGKSSVSNFSPPGTQCNALWKKCSKRINFCNVLYFDLYWLLFFDKCLCVCTFLTNKLFDKNRELMK